MDLLKPEKVDGDQRQDDASHLFNVDGFVKHEV